VLAKQLRDLPPLVQPELVRNGQLVEVMLDWRFALFHLWQGVIRRRRYLLLAVPMVLGTACAAIQRFEVRDTERMLVAAGFHMRLADTPEPQEDLRSIPPYRIVSRTKDGNVVYLYTDPDNCHCVYAGDTKEYSEYERLRREREITQRTAGKAGGAP